MNLPLPFRDDSVFLAFKFTTRNMESRDSKLVVSNEDQKIEIRHQKCCHWEFGDSIFNIKNFELPIFGIKNLMFS